jgi:hypothetical protein
VKFEPVFLLAKNPPALKHFSSSFEKAAIRVEAIQSIEEAQSFMSDPPAGVLVHILQDFGRDEVGLFHHRLVRSTTGKHLHRFVVYRGENLRAQAFSVDCGMRKAIQGDFAGQSLAASVELALNGFFQMPLELQQAVNLVSSGDCELNEEHVELVESVFRRYEHVPCLKLAQARFQLSRGQLKAVVESTRTILNTDPHNARALGYLGEALSDSGLLSDAFRVLCAAEGIAAGNPSRLAALSRLFLRMNQRKNSLALLTKSACVFPVMNALQPLLSELKLNVDEQRIFLEAVVASGCSSENLEKLRSCV